MTDNKTDRCVSCGHFKIPRKPCDNQFCLLHKYGTIEERRMGRFIFK